MKFDILLSLCDVEILGFMSGLNTVSSGRGSSRVNKEYLCKFPLCITRTVFVFCKSINFFPFALHVMEWGIYMDIYFFQASCI